VDYDAQLKLQACLDGELSPRRARRLQGRLAGDPEAQALLRELKATTGALAAFDQDLKLPESREFFWSKIEREIRRLPQPEPARAPASLLAGWRRWLTPAGALAAVLLAALLLGRPARAPQIESGLADSGALTYRDFAASATIVWLSYPAEDEFVADELSDTPD
jgi:anti-sigma factor RsiW